ncbi:histidine phosphatase superfamily [Panaeolus papilionaceus]|nr:histidine phosphatase superfamily [Panaeolus papilionaceus]
MGEILDSRPSPRLFVIRHGEQQVKRHAETFVGPGLLLDPANLNKVIVSPRQRAYKTFQLLFQHLSLVPEHVTSEKVGEWNYGDYEGLKPAEIKALDPNFSIWLTGCPGGESAEHMQSRVDGVISEVREYHRQYFEEGIGARDVLIVAHGHLSRVLITRWINSPLIQGNVFMVGPGSVTVLGYNHHSLDEPAIQALNLFADL